MTKQIRIYLFLFLATLLAGLPAYGQVGSGIITMTTAKNVGDQISLDIMADGDITIEGVKGKAIKDYNFYTIENQQIVIRGNVTTLSCDNNQLAALDVSQNSTLTELSCSQNQLTALDISHNTALTELSCSKNQLTALDISHNTALTELYCPENQLTTMELPKNTALTKLWCQYNQLTELDVSKNTALTELYCHQNQLTALDVSKNTALTVLDCYNNQLTALDVSKNTALTELYCHGNQLTALGVSKNTALTVLYCCVNQLTALNLSQNTTLTTLKCFDNQLTALDVSQNTSLTELYCDNNQLTALDVSKNTALTRLDCYNNQLTALDVSKIALTKLACNNNQLTVLDVSGCTALTTLDCSSNQLTALDVSGCTALNTFDCNNNQLTALEVSGCTALKELDCRYNQLTALDVSGCTALTTFNCSDNKLTALNVSGCTELIELNCSNNRLTALDISGCTELLFLNCSKNQIEADEMTILVKSLPNRRWETPGELCISEVFGEGNVCYRYHVTLAKAKNWNCSYKSGRKFNGSPNPFYAIKQTAEGEGLLKLIGADDLNAVEYGTELTIKATPAEEYELTALTANGADILASKKVVVKEDTEVKAIFTKKTFAVKLTHEGEGTLNATGADNLNAVEIGTELTIEAVPAEEYTLVALTANGADILATKKVVVKEATEVKATFAKKPFTVTLTKEAGEGSLNATGADNLNAVPFGTELTIEATPAEGYTLVALTANGADILATKKVVVKEATEVKATFAKQTFAVKLTKEGEGTLTATGADNLNAVAYGTELTIEVTPAEGYYLMALTANGTDILATKKVVVKEATEVKATFAKKTFAVKLTKEGEGTLTATGADNLNAVEIGTELTIEAVPAEGYTLVALTANGADILATKKVVVKENTEVKAIFTKKIFAVELTQEGEGLLNATGADDLNAVPYGTELTLDATPADGYTLVALTANGADILASKKVVVKEATEVKATFAKKTFTVTLTKEGEGILRSTGAGNLKSVMYATELTIIATPAQGYELKALTANGADILASKKVVVKEDTEVKAIFTKKTFAVELTQEGEGLLNATGAADLSAVPYETELTIEATPAAGYELTALTANGTDILATKKIVVIEATEIKATFAKKTATDIVEAGTMCLYPSPASTYVNVKATKADALVRLYDANGTLLYEARTDDHGLLQIELSAYAEGTYLLLVDGNAQRLLIQR